MPKKLFALALFMLAAQMANAQALAISKYKVGLSPALISLPNVSLGIQPSLQIRLSPKFSLLTELTFLLKNYDVDSSSLNRKFFKVKTELKYYFLPKKKDASVQPYAGFQLSAAFRSLDAMQTKYGPQSYFEQSLPDSCYYSYSSAHISSPVFTATAQLGMEGKISKRLSLDVFAGMGLRFISTKYSDVVNKQYKTDYRFQRGTCMPVSSIQPAYEYNGNVYRLQINLGFRLQYIL